MKNVIYFIIGAVVIVVGFYTFNSGGSSKSYINNINEEREEMEKFMKSDSESPFVQAEVEFQNLNFYKPDPKYNVQASLKKIDVPDIMDIKTSDGEDATFETYAFLEFSVLGKRMALTALKPVSSPNYNQLFVPFGDLTNGDETYGAGRYLEIDFKKGSSTVMVDFNKAHNPYCAYVPNYSCPLPPPQNRLKVEIKAGEKNYE
ncbi:MAG: DUF1684 domain-containing protein [Bacteroidota bacterium]